MVRDVLWLTDWQIAELGFRKKDGQEESRDGRGRVEVEKPRRRTGDGKL